MIGNLIQITGQMDKSLGDDMYAHKELLKLFSEINDDLNKSSNVKVVL